MNRRPWTEAEIEVLRWAYPDRPAAEVARMLGRTVKQVYAAAAHYQVRKSEAYMAAELQRQGERLRRVGAASRIKPGQKPWNKGVPGSAGLHPNSRRTQFKPGELSGQAARNYVPIGSLRIGSDGCLERKVTDDHPVPARRWVGVHRLVWEAERGPVPEGHIVVFRPGMRTVVESEITIDRIELISRVENMARNTRHRLPKPIADVIALRAALTRQINRRRGTKRGPNAKRASNP